MAASSSSEPAVWLAMTSTFVCQVMATLLLFALALETVPPPCPSACRLLVRMLFVAVDLNGARVLLTGASGGIGNAIARALHERGASLAITGRRADALERLRDELGDRVDVLAADLADRADLEALPGRAGTVDVLVANAGLPAAGDLLSFS